MSDVSPIQYRPELDDFYRNIEVATNHDLATIRTNLSYDHFQGDEAAFNEHFLLFRKAAIAAEQSFEMAYLIYASCRNEIIQNIPFENEALYLNSAGVQLVLLPPEIGLLPNLVGINLRVNHLLSLPIEIGKLIHLEELNLVDNRIQSLPICLFHLPALKLILFDNDEENGRALQKLRQMTL